MTLGLDDSEEGLMGLRKNCCTHSYGLSYQKYRLKSSKDKGKI
jgi:hypothetical protein